MNGNGHIPQRDIDAARDWDICEVWGRLALPPLPPHGNACSPFRQDHNPTCEVGGPKNIFHDFAARESLDSIALVRKVKGCGFKEAVAFILGRPVGGAAAPRSVDPLEDLAARRTWTVAALKALGCKSERREVHFPMRDHQGKIIGWRRRRGDNGKYPDENKALAVKGSKNGLFYPSPLPEGLALVAEGEADTVAALSANWPCVVGTPGAKPSRECIGYLQRLLAGREVVLAPDPDTAGRGWLAEIGEALANVQCRVRYIPAGAGDLDKRLKQEATH